MITRELLTPLIRETFALRNKVVMAPMNRRRATDGIPDASMITYYKQRAGAGLIITDNTAIASNGGAYLHTPGIYNEAQKAAWKKIVDTVHAEGGKIVIQLVHAGRIGHPAIQHNEPLIAPSAIKVNESILTPDGTYQPMTEPRALSREEIPYWIAKYKEAALNAIEVGFDGVEIHAAHGFLIDEFLNPYSNKRTDDYGGSIENRSRFLLEVVHAVADAIGKDKTGIRLSPFREIYDIKPYPEELATHEYVVDELQKAGIWYLHFSNAVVNGIGTIQEDYLRNVRARFTNTIMVAGGYTAESGEVLLQLKLVDLIAFGKLYISNPDLVERLRQNAPLAEWDEKTFYHGGESGYIDYPSLS
ncbi:MAG: alkene reductase [Filimonas sp.]|nr:alkene reductase [Filimonas sp.]